MSNQIVIVQLKPLKCLETFTPEVVGKVIHISTVEDVQEKMTGAQALKLHNDYVGKEDALAKGTADAEAHRELFDLFKDNMETVGVEVLPDQEEAGDVAPKISKAGMSAAKAGKTTSADKAKSEPKEKKTRTSKYDPGEKYGRKSKITVVAKENPYRANSSRAVVWGVLAKAKTIGKLVDGVQAMRDAGEACMTSDRPTWDIERALEDGLITIETVK